MPDATATSTANATTTHLDEVTAPTGRPRARVVLLGGASGSGKTLLTRLLGLPRLELDDFYRDGDDPLLAQRFDGLVDWDDPVSWDADAAVAAIIALCRDGAADVPTYDIPSSRRTGTLRLDLGESPLFIAEGIFAADLTLRVQQLGLLADAMCLRRNRGLTFARRLARDLVEARKPVPVLLRRGVRLSRDEPGMLARWDGLGCRLVDRDEALVSLRALAHPGTVPAARLHRTVDFAEHLAASVAGVATLLRDGDLAAPVPTCPGWTVADLVEHLGGIHRWVTVAITEHHGRGEQPAAPRGRADLQQWFDVGAEAMLTALRARDACDPCWTLAPPRTVAFWWRRQAHENAMHAWDLSVALNRRVDYPGDLAGDGISEVLDTLVPRQVRLGRLAQPPAVVALEATDSAESWRLGGTADAGAQDPVAVVRAERARLLLLLWRRATFEDPGVVVTGDSRVAREVLGQALTP